MRPYDVLPLTGESPMIQGLAPNYGAQQLTFDLSGAIPCRDARDTGAGAIDNAREIRIVATSLHAQQGTAEARHAERRARLSNAIKCSPHRGGDEEPRAAGGVVERQPMRWASPAACGETTTDGEADLVRRCSTPRVGRRRYCAGYETTPGHQQRWIDSGVELRVRAAEILQEKDVCAFQQQLPDSTAGERPPQLGG